MFGWLKRLKEEPQKRQVSRPSWYTTTKVWGVLQGPVFAKDIPDCGLPDDAVMMIMKVSRGEEVFDAEFWFESFEDAYALEKHFKENFEPIELNNSKEP